jgi:hypothetical protein
VARGPDEEAKKEENGGGVFEVQQRRELVRRWATMTQQERD